MKRKENKNEETIIKSNIMGEKIWTIGVTQIREKKYENWKLIAEAEIRLPEKRILTDGDLNTRRRRRRGSLWEN